MRGEVLFAKQVPAFTDNPVRTKRSYLGTQSAAKLCRHQVTSTDELRPLSSALGEHRVAGGRNNHLTGGA